MQASCVFTPTFFLIHSALSSMCIPYHTFICHLIKLFLFYLLSSHFTAIFLNSFQLVSVCLILKKTRNEQSIPDAGSPGFYRIELLLHCSGIWCLCLNWSLLWPYCAPHSYNLLFPGSKKWLDILFLDFSIVLNGCFCGDYLSLYLSLHFSKLNLNLFPIHISKLFLSPVISLPTQTFTLPLSLRLLVGNVLVWK